MVRSGLLLVAALLLLASSGSAPLQAQTPEDIFMRGNAAYEEGHYAESVEAYRSLLRYDVRDPIVEYNLGNAEFRVGNLGLAILHYERARRLDPIDEDIRSNLEFARSFCFDRVDRPPQAAVVRWLQATQNGLGPDRQAWILLALGWLLVGVVAWCSSRPGGWKVRNGWTLAVLLLLLLFVASSWYATLERLDGQPSAVVLDDVVEVLAGPGLQNPALFTVHEGLTLEIRSERDEWLQVSLPNGLNGWIAKGSVQEV